MSWPADGRVSVVGMRPRTDDGVAPPPESGLSTGLRIKPFEKSLQF